MPLNKGQEAALTAYNEFLIDPDQQEFVITGGPGTGKTYLVSELIKGTPSMLAFKNMVTGDDTNSDIILTATTNKAAANLSAMTKHRAVTIQSLMKLRVIRDFKNGTESLKATPSSGPIDNKIIFIDEAGIVDKLLAKYIYEYLGNSKIVYIGDKDQMRPVNSASMPVFDTGKKTVELTQVMRQDMGNTIPVISQALRETVRDGSFPYNLHDGINVIKCNGPQFQEVIDDVIGNPNYRESDGKILCWTNKRVQQYNMYARDLHYTNEAPQEGEEYIVRKPVMQNDSIVARVEELLTLRSVEHAEISGHSIYQCKTTSGIKLNIPKEPAAIEAIKNKYKREKDWRKFYAFQDHFADVRPVYASTVHCSQGSTYDTVFIDLEDIGRNNKANEVARLLYVAISRAKNTVYLKGELPSKYRQ
jgi:ATP-dependent exoDNAse (exonuclease V) alpha subunit